MKILYHHRIRSKDGQYVHLEEMVHAFQSRQHLVELVGPKVLETASFGAGGGFSDTLRAKLPKAAFELLEFGYAFAAFFRLWFAIGKIKPDFIYERFNLFFPVGVFAAKLKGIPLVLEVNGPLLQERSAHGGLSLKGLARWTQEYTWKNATLTLPVTNVLADYLREAGVAEERILIIPNGVEFERFSKADPNEIRKKYGIENRIVLGFTGFVRPWHGVDSIIQAMGEGTLPSNSVLLMVGDGPALPDLKALAKKLNIEDRVFFSGLVSRDEIQKYVASFDIALQPAVVAWASPLKVMEYLAASNAIVAPIQPNIQELLVHEENALLFHPDRPLERIAAIARLCESAQLRERLGRNACATIDRLELLWTANARRIVEKLEKLTA